jgi:hypothetical protein
MFSKKLSALSLPTEVLFKRGSQRKSNKGGLANLLNMDFRQQLAKQTHSYNLSLLYTDKKLGGK